MQSGILKPPRFLTSSSLILLAVGWVSLFVIALNRIDRKNKEVLKAIEKEAKKVSIDHPISCTSNRDCRCGRGILSV